VSIEVAPASSRKRRRRRLSTLNKSDKITLSWMAGIPTFLHVFLVWIPALTTVSLSFMTWKEDDVFSGSCSVGEFFSGSCKSNITFAGLKNYRLIFTVFSEQLSEALFNNLVVLVFLFLVPTTFGMLLAYLLDKQIRGSSVYQSIYYFPVVLSLAVVGVIWKTIIYSPRQGVLNSLFGGKGDQEFDILAKQIKLIKFKIGFLDSIQFFKHGFSISLSLVAILAAMAWRHAGYIMVLYLAGLKSVDPSLREAGAIDGCSEWVAFRRIIFPTMKPINIIVIVITMIEGLRSYDIVVAMGEPKGSKLTSLLVTKEFVGAARGEVGKASSYGVVLFALCLTFIIWYVRNNFREERAV
jgi:multiple sugar transport system permease protein